MKKFLKDYSIIIGFILTFILDSQYGIIEYFIKDSFLQNLIKGLGALILAYFTNKKFKNSEEISAKMENNGGAVIPNKGF